MEKKSPGRFEQKRLGGYLIESLLARGGMGEVYLAYDERLRRRVVIKRIRGEAHLEKRRRRRFRREARAVARLSHPAIVQIFDILDTEEGDCIVMEYVAGSSLRQLAADRLLEMPLALRLAGEIADGLAEAHSKGLVHRDLKSENVLVTFSGHAKILDFGLARWTWEEDQDSSSLTEPGVLVGTVHAMSPEQVRGGLVDHRSDLFAFGVLLYEMLAGRSPFLGEDLPDTLGRILRDSPPSIREFRPETPPPLVKLVERLLAKDPYQRPPSVRLVTMELARLGAELDAPASPLVLSRSTAAAKTGPEAPTPTDDDLVTASALRAPPDLGWRPEVDGTIPRRENWRLERRIGEGGFGEVWRARHRATGEPRVFKFCFDGRRLRALRREVTLLRLLREALGARQDIAHILDWNLDDPPCFLETEYNESGDLPSWAESRGGLAEVSLETRLEIVAEVAEALAAAHSVGILHKDVKPANVLIASDLDGRPHVRLSDFGIGLLTEPGRLSAEGIIALGLTDASTDAAGETGTLRYLAPELIAGKRPTIQSDVYSLGVLLYQMVVADFSRVLAPGWHREVDDELLCDDLARFVDGVPERRPASTLEVAERLRSLEPRRQRLVAERRARREEQRMAEAFERTRRRRRWLAASAVVTAIVLAVVAVFAWRAERDRRRAAAARQDAELRRGQAESLIGFMLGDLRRQLEPIGRLAILREVGDEALEYFAAVPEEDLSDEESRHRARTFYQIGSVRQELGDFPAAGEAFGKALDLARDRVAREPGDDEWQFELGQSLFWVGNYYLQERDFDRAQEYFQGYLEIAERLVARDPRRDDWQLELAYAHSNLASVLDARGESAAALVELAPSVAVLEGLLERQPDHAVWQLELSHVLSKIGSLRKAEGDLTGAAQSFEATLAILHRSADQAPDDAALKRYLATAHNHLGDLLEDLGDPHRALEHYRADLELTESLAGSDPESATAKRELAVSHHEVGRLHQRLGDLTLAGEHFLAAAELTGDLVARDPEHTMWRLEAASSHQALASLRLAEGLTQRALEEVEEAMALLEPLAQTAPEDTRGRLLRSETLWVLGRVWEVRGEGPAARAAWDRAVRIIEPLAREQRDLRFLEIWVLALLALDRLDQARPVAEELYARGFREPRFLELCRVKDLCPDLGPIRDERDPIGRPDPNPDEVNRIAHTG